MNVRITHLLPHCVDCIGQEEIEKQKEKKKLNEQIPAEKKRSNTFINIINSFRGLSTRASASIKRERCDDTLLS